MVWSADATNSISSRSSGAGRAVVAANEEVLCWDIRKGELLSRWRDKDCKSQVTALAQSKVDPDVYAVGHEDGSIRIWDSKIATVIVSFNGHRSAITILSFDKSGVRLASGSKDTDVIIWDLVAEVGQYKLRGHKDQITGLEFIQPEAQEKFGEDGENAVALPGESENGEGFLLTASKDALIKLWDLTSQHCIETHVAQTNGECWSLGVSPDCSGCITAGNDGELNIWSINTPGLLKLSKEVDAAAESRYLRNRGILHRQGKDKTIEVKFHPREDYFSVHGSEKAIEIWRIRSEDEVRKSLARKRKRRREKLGSAAEKMDLDAEVDEDMEEEEDEDAGDAAGVVAG